MNIDAPAQNVQQDEIAALHDRLAKNADYTALSSLVDARVEAVLSGLEKPGRTFEEYITLTGELRGLRAARGASTHRRGR